jgi:DNA mismatch endonuclease (patch repair protein)
MSDVFDVSKRREIMRAIRGKDTRVELAVRSLAHALGFRFRLHRKGLPGTPDLVFPRLRKVIFVHGCFWHLHSCNRGQSAPITNAEFWSAKRGSNALRDRRNILALRRLGWQVLVVWECQVRNPETLSRRLTAFLTK